MNREFIICDMTVCLSCSWSVQWSWRTGMTSWRRVTCRTGRRLWPLSWPTLSPRSSLPSAVSLRIHSNSCAIQLIRPQCCWHFVLVSLFQLACSLSYQCLLSQLWICAFYLNLSVRPSRGKTGGSRGHPTASPGLSVLHLCRKRGETCVLLDQGAGRALSTLSPGVLRKWLQLCFLNLQ